MCDVNEKSIKQSLENKNNKRYVLFFQCRISLHKYFLHMTLVTRLLLTERIIFLLTTKRQNGDKFCTIM